MARPAIPPVLVFMALLTVQIIGQEFVIIIKTKILKRKIYFKESWVTQKTQGKIVRIKKKTIRLFTCLDSVWEEPCLFDWSLWEGFHVLVSHQHLTFHLTHRGTHRQTIVHYFNITKTEIYICYCSQGIRIGSSAKEKE